MNDPVLLLDSTVLVAYERDLTRRAQAVVLDALAEVGLENVCVGHVTKDVEDHVQEPEPG